MCKTNSFIFPDFFSRLYYVDTKGMGIHLIRSVNVNGSDQEVVLNDTLLEYKLGFKPTSLEVDSKGTC